MSLHAMDTHKTVQEFLAAGVEQPVAEVMVAAIDGAVSQHMLTKDEMEAVTAAAIEELANKADLEAIARELHLVKGDVVVLKSDTAVLKSDTAVLKKDVAVLKSDTAVLKKDVAVLKSDTAVLKKDVAVLKSDTAVLKKDVAVLKKDVDTLNGKVDKLEGTMQEHKTEFKQSQLENQAEHARLEALIKSEIGRHRDETNASLRRLEKSMAKLKTQLLIYMGCGLVASTGVTVAILGFLIRF